MKYMEIYDIFIYTSEWNNVAFYFKDFILIFLNMYILIIKSYK